MKQLTEQLAQTVVRPRQRDTYKGSFGKILIVGGNAQFGGAAIMSASAAVYAGAGLVSVATDPVNRSALHARLPEAMILDAASSALETAIRQATVIVVGPGLGTDNAALAILKRVFAAVEQTQVLIIDGSAITLVAAHQLDYPNAQLIWTPHQVEWQRLSGLALSDQTVTASQQAASHIPGIVVAKSSQTHVFVGDDVYENMAGGPAMATGGSGDTLTGIIAAFAGQFQPLKQAVLAAVFVHSHVADIVAMNSYVALPTMIIRELPTYLKQLSES
ncbi:NAD(P)H-hydrate dehydratase [Lacticaseibacillus chiayiensis]|uniref:ADP-dependent (S)-NAD(P)H-hydrate dehydratase n=1 Tax=Lacticaseibacillus chiayiensis TaxID=2100821 RepID=A0A4Q1U3M0_9LACO|nr:NAD(P)H-hydrate dehydratase [Lacticaseibacillus chiayiensis]QVI35410.1 NAD(P)H-hydrate dehydratase [Lacticaseibacillus chiayiensis]RXT25557.1 NAD(P)H-hydrate dehydratase [Lacticaseibacillus chiayiensis]RXT59385.1 NAD(P)H-hydrate dehydratase [Lacticaseibacillus chiayiensis]UYN57250.1 NAD(P)H-hydrate dehydratase [Lacticaseibacillus chiayiensis]